jgi:PAS domain S-box-containing protein
MTENTSLNAPQGNGPGTSQDLQPLGRHYLATRLLLTAAAMLVGMSVYQFLEFLIFPDLTVWESGIITVLFGTGVATVAAYFVLRRISALLERISMKAMLRKKTEEKLSKVFLANPDWVIISRLSDGCYIDVNEAFLRMTGYSREEVIGHSSIDLHIWFEPEERKEMVRILREVGRVSNHEVRFGMKSGNIRSMLWSAERIYLDGEACMIAVCKDITGLIKAAEERERLIDQLENALLKVMQLSGFLPICTTCKKVRDSQDHWKDVESYLHTHAKAKFINSICPDCAKEVNARICANREDSEDGSKLRQ